MLEVFEEPQVYRIDHYLGKQTVQNLLVFRFGNGIFEPLWNRNYIDHVQITASESLGVEARAAFYESAGALRDMVQSHMLQLTSLVSMEAPAVFDATAVRNEKIKVLQSIRHFTEETVLKTVVRGQYGPGTVNGKQVPGYRQEKGVNPGVGNRNVRSAEAAGRQLALGWSALLSSHRQTSRPAENGNNHPVQAGSSPGVSRIKFAAERTRAEHPAGRRNFPFLRRKGARRADAYPPGDYGFPVQPRVWHGLARRLRHPDQRLHPWRRHAV